MSKSLRSIPEKERMSVIMRRISKGTMGLGYWAAVDAMAKITKKQAQEVVSKK